MDQDKISCLRYWNKAAFTIHAINTLSQIYLGVVKSKWKFRIENDYFRAYPHSLCLAFNSLFGKGGIYENVNSDYLSLEYCEKQRKAILSAKNKLNSITFSTKYDSSDSKNCVQIPSLNGTIILNADEIISMLVGLYGFHYIIHESDEYVTKRIYEPLKTIVDSPILYSYFRTNYNLKIIYNSECNRMELESLNSIQIDTIQINETIYKSTCGNVVMSVTDFIKSLRNEWTVKMRDNISFKIKTEVLKNIPTVELAAFSFFGPLKNKIARIPLSLTVAGFSAICCLAHGTLLYLGENLPISSSWNYYNMILVQKVNYIRWIEYSLSSGLMLVNIAALTQIRGFYDLLNIFIGTSITNYFGLWTELAEKSFKPYPFALGFIPFMIPWIQIYSKMNYISSYFAREIKPLIEYKNNGTEFAADIPLIFKVTTFSLFAIYFGFPVNMYLQYWIYGKENGYYRGEKNYLILSAFSKSFLSWMIFAGTLREDKDYLGKDEETDECSACKDLN